MCRGGKVPGVFPETGRCQREGARRFPEQRFPEQRRDGTSGKVPSDFPSRGAMVQARWCQAFSRAGVFPSSSLSSRRSTGTKPAKPTTLAKSSQRTPTALSRSYQKAEQADRNRDPTDVKDAIRRTHPHSCVRSLTTTPRAAIRNTDSLNSTQDSPTVVSKNAHERIVSVLLNLLSEDRLAPRELARVWGAGWHRADAWAFLR